MGVSGRVGGSVQNRKGRRVSGRKLLGRAETQIQLSSLQTRAKWVKGEVGRDEERWKLQATENGRAQVGQNLGGSGGNGQIQFGGLRAYSEDQGQTKSRTRFQGP